MSSNSGSKNETHDVLLSWRKRLFYLIFTVFLILLSVPYFVSMRVAISQGDWFILSMHTCCVLVALVVVIFRRIPFALANWLGISVIFIVAANAVINIGPAGSGRIWLFSFSMIVTILYGMKAGISTVVLNLLTLTAAGYLFATGSAEWLEVPRSTVQFWIVTSVTFIFLNALVVVSVALLVGALEKRLLQESRLREEITRANVSLEESEEMLRQAIQGSAVPAFIINADHRITHWNDACAKITGRTAEEMVGTGKHWVAFGSREGPVPADLVIEMETGREVEAGENIELIPSRLVPGGYEGEATISPCGGGEKHLFWTAAPLRDRDGTTVGAIQTLMDMTDSKRIEAQLRQVQKLDAVGRLAGGVAHDFNNMLSVIIGHTDMLLEKLKSDSVLRKDAEAIRNAGLRSADLTRQLLAFARKQNIEPEIVDLNSSIFELSTMLRTLIGEDIDLEIIEEDGIWPVSIDRSQMDQILTNLCVNARDAIEGVGSITIEISNISIDNSYCSMNPEAVPGDYVLLAVSDDGPGMGREIIEQIFEPFFTTKEAGRGTGLGLSTIHGIVKQNGGHVTVYSEEGSGSTFKIYLPKFMGKDKGTGDELETELKCGCGEKLLLVEDEEAIRNLTSTMLFKLGYRVMEAGSPEEVLSMNLEELAGTRLLITDVVMPGMNGKDLADRLVDSIPNLKVLFISGYTADVIARRGVVDEGVAFLAKPFSSIQLGIKVRQVLDG